MINLSQYISESLIKSYPYEKIKNKLIKKYGNKISETFDYKSKSNIKTFAITIDNEQDFEYITNDHSFYKILDFFGFYITTVKYIKEEQSYVLEIEPIFTEKCNDLVFNKCHGRVYHLTRKNIYDKYISKNGLKPRSNSTYRQFSERIFLYCGKNKEEIIYNTKKIIEQLDYIDYTILEVNVSKYNVDFYYDSYQLDDTINFIYCNSIFYPNVIKEMGNIDQLEKKLIDIDESKSITTPKGNKIYCQII